MLTIPRPVCACAVLATALTLVAACTGTDEDATVPLESPTDLGAALNTPGDTNPESAATPEIGGPAPNILGFDSLRSMVEWQPYVLVGEVLEGARPFFLDPDQVCPVPFLISPVRVERVIYAPEDVGDQIELVQQSGSYDEDCAVSEGSGEAAVKPGQRFLLFIQDLEPSGFPGYGGFWAGRFEIAEGDLVVPNSAERYYAGPAELTGATEAEIDLALASADPQSALHDLARTTIEQAADKVLQAVSLGPIPNRTEGQAP